jgi:uncharacterized protein Yka (UPF0111/DUF47 family)
MKSGIIDRLGQTDLLLPSLIASGLAANDRVKIRLTILQEAARHASDPQAVRFDLASECRAAGIDHAGLETLVNHASLTAGEWISAPGLSKLAGAIWDDVADMIRPIAAADGADARQAEQRLAGIKAAIPFGLSDDLELRNLTRLTGLGEAEGDSLHRLIMDLHKALNRLAADHADEMLAGAHVYGLSRNDRPAIEAFMRGVASTQKLRFGHPGLTTTATHGDGRLTIQNDIGETDAHVVVITVATDSVTVTYTDVHLARARFFVSLFRGFPVEWSGLTRKSASGLPTSEAFYLITGRFLLNNVEQRDAFLEAIGASLVFLIDWNKARKILREWVPKGDAIRVLQWAATHRIGHRGFLELGGSELVAGAVHHATPTRIGFGERLDSALGRDAAVDFLKSVLRISTEALLEGVSIRLVRDRIEAELIGHLQRVDSALLAIVIRQAGLAHEIASGIGEFIGARLRQRPLPGKMLAERARRIEEKADLIALEARSEIARFDADPAIERLVNQLEDTIDELEQAAFVVSLLPPETPAELLEPLAELCAATIAGTEAAAAGITAAAEFPSTHRVDTDDALEAVARLIDAEHKGDGAERAVTAKILAGEFAFKTAMSVLEFARALERATDRLAAFGHLMRQRVLADLSE